MFTGIVEEVGEVISVNPLDGGIRILISAKTVINETKLGDSVNVNGACQTVVEFSEDSFAVEAVGETLEKTNLGLFQKGSAVNLERPLTFSSRIGGHLVQGHVNATAQITNWYPRGENWFLEVEVPMNLQRYLIAEGSITIDGISLTIASLRENQVGINIIPHTVEHTNLSTRAVGDTVNIEVDMIAKYVENMMKYAKPQPIIESQS